MLRRWIGTYLAICCMTVVELHCAVWCPFGMEFSSSELRIWSFSFFACFYFQGSIDYCVKAGYNGGEATVVIVVETEVTNAPSTQAHANSPTASGPTVDPNLPPLQTVADEPEMPLGLCQGDCDSDEDCLDELVCFQRDYLERVPGCSGQGTPSYDYCIAGPLGGSAEVTACTDDALTCPDGSILARELPSCEFPACPQVLPCAADIMMCPDGTTTVIRTQPDCEFAACPADDAALVACSLEVLPCDDGSFVGREG
jgi:hypothetical protein